ncbi:transcriptional regulatory protein [Rhodospirillum rubrum ATCC 11170]|uniref:Transcriptional regulatory protein n=1 Tax=Rhodospirillum rubrum (strain ATCC 11170 / ATH 1.1.1 / DSM 467 / LMG 4362 / NCIMB 8255 / S1) TaxID=269796 RepID=Q2RS62_RHORT|nr:transcriptional regulatory protein [Rhodospirillum rubrum ATCC 11170]MBK5954660.1 MarR family transcriptional regulator [Rhodospirillum rubrum]HAP99655.1 MarR family transcriptional regulator [Rhodospirillum rubrum]HCF16772.1 MarR family transcriptional regulator [Rhodospirillum rubrum]
MKRTNSSKAVAELLTQIGRLSHSHGFTGGLNPAQWMALRYFGQANPSVCTVMRFADFYGSSRGTASQSISALVRKGYLVRRPSPEKKSSHILEVTDAGRVLLSQDPIKYLIRGIEGLPASKVADFAESLEILIRHLFKEGDGDDMAIEPSE